MSQWGDQRETSFWSDFIQFAAFVFLSVAIIFGLTAVGT